MIKFGLLVGVLVVGVVLIIVGAGGPGEPDEIGGKVRPADQEKFEQSKGTFRWALIIGIVVCLLSIGGFVLMARSCLCGKEGDQAVAAAGERPPGPDADEQAQEDEESPDPEQKT